MLKFPMMRNLVLCSDLKYDYLGSDLSFCINKMLSIKCSFRIVF